MSGTGDGGGVPGGGPGGGGPDNPAAALERRYRTLLRMLPKRYREARGEELLDTLMEGAGQRRWPDPREALSLAGLSVRTRFAAGGTGSRGAPRPGETARVVAFLGSALLGYQALILHRVMAFDTMLLALAALALVRQARGGKPMMAL